MGAGGAGERDEVGKGLGKKDKGPRDESTAEEQGQKVS